MVMITNNNDKSEICQNQNVDVVESTDSTCPKEVDFEESNYLTEADPMDNTYCNHRGKTKEKDALTETSESLIFREESKPSSTTLDCMTLLSYHEAPSYLQFNPYILSGYRGYLSTKMCFESMFWMTNETINIWSHVFGWMLFLGLTLYDLFLLNIHASFTDKFIVGLLLACFQICMVMSSLYHIFSCRSEHTFNYFLSFDLLGIALSMLGIYMTGVYYAYWCHKSWQTFYLVTVCAFFLIAMLLQLPGLKVDDHVKMLMFVLWAAYGVVPTAHWTVMMGGLENPLVSLLLPRVVMMYGIIGLAFFIYITRIPERFFTGKVDYIGSSHQWWHFFVVVALYYWHNTGIKYIEYRMNHGCAYDLTL